MPIIEGLRLAWAFRWPLMVILALIAAGIQTLRLDVAVAHLEASKVSLVAAQAKAKEKASESAKDSVQQFTENENEDRPVVERVVTRVRNICLPQTDRVQVPAPAPGTERASSGDADTEDRARDESNERYVEAVEQDLSMCSGQLNRLRSVLKFYEGLE